MITLSNLTEIIFINKFFHTYYVRNRNRKKMSSSKQRIKPEIIGELSKKKSEAWKNEKDTNTRNSYC